MASVCKKLRCYVLLTLKNKFYEVIKTWMRYMSIIFIRHILVNCPIAYFYLRAIHSTETKMPPGNGITWGVLLAGGFSGKNSL